MSSRPEADPLDAPFCHRCGHACAHDPPHTLVDAAHGPVCVNEAWCAETRAVDEAFWSRQTFWRRPVTQAGSR